MVIHHISSRGVSKWYSPLDPAGFVTNSCKCLGKIIASTHIYIHTYIHTKLLFVGTVCMLARILDIHACMYRHYTRVRSGSSVIPFYVCTHSHLMCITMWLNVRILPRTVIHMECVYVPWKYT